MKRFCLLLMLIILVFTQENLIKKVTLYQGKALIEREKIFSLKQGVQEISFENLPFSIIESSIQIAAPTNTFLKSFKIEPVAIKLESKNKLDELNKKKKELNDQIKLADGNKEAAKQEKEFVLSMAKLNNQDKTPSKYEFSANKWETMFKYFREKLSTIDKEIIKIELEKTQLLKLISDLDLEINKINLHAQNVFNVKAIIECERDISGAVFTIKYLVEKADWVPFYDIYTNTETRELEFQYNAKITNNTGEDWSKVNLQLSTADISKDHQLPNLDQWFVEQQQYEIVAVNNNKKNVNANKNKSGQKNTIGGIISGFITDKMNNEGLPGVNVNIVNTSLGSSTDVDGFYEIQNVPAGIYEVSVTYVGYKSYSIKGVRVNVNNNTIISTSLEEALLEGDVVEVIAKKELVRKSESNSRQIYTSEQINHDYKINNSNQIKNLPNTTIKDVITGSSGVIKNNNPQIFLTDLERTVASTVFEIKDKISIKSYDPNKKVPISKFSSSVVLEYSCVPKINNTIYVHLKSKNESEYPILAGSANIYNNNIYVNQLSMPSVYPNDSISFDLGLEQGINVKRKQISRLEESKGTFSKSKKYNYVYQFEINNNMNKEIELTLYDQIPSSNHEDIKVVLLEPNLELDKSVTKNADNSLIWKLKFNKKENKKFELKYSVEYPSKMNISGLE